MNYRSLHNLIDDSKALAAIIPPDQYDYIVPIFRSGLIPAQILAHAHDNDTVLSVASATAMWPTNHKPRLLLVDDSINTGTTLAQIKKNMAFPDDKIKVASVYVNSPDQADYFAHVLPHPRIFEWNFWRNPLLRHVMSDMDGVICEDHPKDDKTFYRRRNATPINLPEFPLHSVCTGRFEEDRWLTQKWLDAHNVKGALYMRLESEPVSTHKARVYAASTAQLFIESDRQQAHHIARLSGKPCIHAPTMELLHK